MADGHLFFFSPTNTTITLLRATQQQQITLLRATQQQQITLRRAIQPQQNHSQANHTTTP